MMKISTRHRATRGIGTRGLGIRHDEANRCREDLITPCAHCVRDGVTCCVIQTSQKLLVLTWHTVARHGFRCLATRVGSQVYAPLAFHLVSPLLVWRARRLRLVVLRCDMLICFVYHRYLPVAPLAVSAFILSPFFVCSLKPYRPLYVVQSTCGTSW